VRWLRRPAFLSPDRRFAALASPAGVVVAEYREEAEGLVLLEEHRDETPCVTAHDAAMRVAALVALHGAIRGDVAIVVRDLEVRYRMLQLPPAAPELLRPIALRELGREYPDLDTPVVGLVPTRRRRARDYPEPDGPEGSTAAPSRGREEYLVAIAPRAVPAAFDAELAAQGVTGSHLTILPQALQRLYAGTDGGVEPTALVLFTPGGPLLGFFQDGILRHLAEPRGVAGDEGVDAALLVAPLERGAIFLRQQFRGAQLTRVLVAAETRAQLEATNQASAELDLRVEPFVPMAGSPAALLALGAALDATENGLTLFEPSTARATRLAPPATLVTRMAAAAAAATLVVALWMGVEARRLEQQRVQLRMRVEQQLAQLAPTFETARARQAAAAAGASIEAVSAEHRAMRRAILTLASAAPPGIVLDSIVSARDSSDPARWRFAVGGRSEGHSGSQVVRALDTFYQQAFGAPIGVALVDRRLDHLDYGVVADTIDRNRLTLQFRITFAATRPTVTP